MAEEPENMIFQTNQWVTQTNRKQAIIIRMIANIQNERQSKKKKNVFSFLRPNTVHSHFICDYYSPLLFPLDYYFHIFHMFYKIYCVCKTNMSGCGYVCKVVYTPDPHTFMFNLFSRLFLKLHPFRYHTISISLLQWNLIYISRYVSPSTRRLTARVCCFVFQWRKTCNHSTPAVGCNRYSLVNSK